MSEPVGDIDLRLALFVAAYGDFLDEELREFTALLKSFFSVPLHFRKVLSERHEPHPGTRGHERTTENTTMTPVEEARGLQLVRRCDAFALLR